MGSIGSDGKTLPVDRAAKWGRVPGLEDYVVTSANNDLQVVMQIILDGNTKNLLSKHLTKAAVATCPDNESNAVVVYVAENVTGNAAAHQKVQALRSIKVPINESAGKAEAAIVNLKEELLELVRRERMARLHKDAVAFSTLGKQIGATIQ